MCWPLQTRSSPILNIGITTHGALYGEMRDICIFITVIGILTPASPRSCSPLYSGMAAAIRQCCHLHMPRRGKIEENAALADNAGMQNDNAGRDIVDILAGIFTLKNELK